MKNLNTQFNNFKNIKPRSDYKSKNRELLFSQVYNSAEIRPVEFSFGLRNYAQQFFVDFVNVATQPISVVLFILVFLLGGGFLSSVIAKDSKPGDSLYIAKRISEKMQLALAFGEKEKVQLRIDFAGNRVDEIKQVLANDKENKTETKKTVSDLANNAKIEVRAAKTSLQKISKNVKIDTKVKKENVSAPVDSVSAPVNSVSAPVNSVSAPVNSVNNASTSDASSADDSVFSANLEKDKQGISVSDENVNKSNSNVDSKTLLNQAKESLKSNDVVSTLSTLEKVDEAIDKTVDSGEVRGVSEESATTTGEVQ